MKRWAKIDGGVVTYVTESDTQPSAGWVECTGLPVGPGYTYDGAVFAAPPAPVYKLIRVDAFWARFTNPERVAYNVAMQHDPAASNSAKNAAAKLRIFAQDLNEAGYCKLAANNVVNTVNDLEAQAVIGAGRAAAILTAPITAEEAWIK